MCRFIAATFVVCLTSMFTPIAAADVRNLGRIVLEQESQRAAVAGQVFSGVLLVTAPEDGEIEEVEIVGRGWSDIAIELPINLTVSGGDVLRIPFHGTPQHADEPLRVRVFVAGKTIEQEFKLSEASLEVLKRPFESGSFGAHFPDGSGSAAPRGCEDQQIRVHGRIEYVRPDGQVIGADSIKFQIWDEDVFDSELMAEGLTDQQGNFDLTICWDDCDVSGCDDPDIYLVYTTDTDVAVVRNNDQNFTVYKFSSQNTLIFEDFTGNDVDFGVQRPTDTTLFPALHMFNSMVRSHRYVLENSGYDTPVVNVVWQTANGAFYSNSTVTINIGPDEQWNEGTQVHEWGHHLLYQWTAPVASAYCNGFCDDSSSATPCGSDTCVNNGGHCIWCRETLTDAWNEGFPNWLGSALLRLWQGRYGGPPPISINDSRYTLETVQNCCDGTQHNATTTEGFVAALLRDIEDPPQDPGQTVCPQDSLWLGGDEILGVVRAYAPIRVTEFINAFRTEYPQYQHDFRSTAQAVSPTYVTGWPAPPVNVLGNTGCGTYQVGETITLSVQTNASGYSTCMRWLRNGVELSDGGRISGATTDRLVISAATGADAGSYALRIFSCDGSPANPCAGTQSITSSPIIVRIIDPNGPSSVATGWGRNTFGMLGRGTDQPDSDVNPGEVVNLPNVVAVSAGYWNSAALKSDGTVWAWGAGPLGDGTSAGSWTPVQVSTSTGMTNVVAVHAGGSDETTIALDADGHVWTWGSAFFGQLGYSQPSGVALNPGQVNGLDCVVDVSMGWSSAAAVTSDGSLWVWGTNYSGQLGLGTVGGTFTTPQRVVDLANVVDVECGGVHILARLADGSVWAAGSNQQGQLGDGTLTDRNRFTRVINMPDAIAISAGGLHSLAIRADSSAWGWGMNGSGELGVNFGVGWNPTPLHIPAPATVRSIDGGYGFSAFVAGDGTIWTCGYNGNGALGRVTSGNNFAVALPVDTRVGAAISASAGAWNMFTVAPGARITAPIADKFVPGCSQVQFVAQTVGVPPINYQWRRGGVPLTDNGHIVGAQSATMTIHSTDTNDTALYDVVVSNSANTVTSNPISLVTPALLTDFDTPPTGSDWWNNERGDWGVASGAWAAGTPGIYAPLVTYSSFDSTQADFLIELDVPNASHANFDTNGGIWLRSNFANGLPYPTGVVLAFGEAFPWGGGDVYWHRNYGSGYQSAQNVAHNVYTAGQTLHLRIEVRGDTYTCWANDAQTPSTTLVTSEFPAGRIALLDGVASGTSFDNIFIQTLSNCPNGSGLEPVRVMQRPQSQSVASGSPVALSVFATGSGPLSYQWLRNGECIAGATAANYDFIATPASAGRYECTVSNACGSLGSYPATIALTGGGPQGDLDGDGHVGLQDLAILLSSFGLCSGMPGFVAAADLDGDGCVGLQDMAVLLAHFGT